MERKTITMKNRFPVIASIIMILAGILNGSCSKNNERSELKGRWNWISSSGGYARMTYTPESTGTTKQLKIGINKIYFYENNNRKEKTKYRMIKSTSIYSRRNAELIETKSSDIRQSFEIRNDTLILREECFDCFTHMYTKKN